MVFDRFSDDILGHQKSDKFAQGVAKRSKPGPGDPSRGVVMPSGTPRAAPRARRKVEKKETRKEKRKRDLARQWARGPANYRFALSYNRCAWVGRLIKPIYTGS